MALSAEQKVIIDTIGAHVREIQGAVQKALPSMRSLHDDFRVGRPLPTTPAGAVELAKAIAPLAKENRQLLIGRGVDGALLTHLDQLALTLEKLGPAEPAPPAPAAEKPAARKGRKKA